MLNELSNKISIIVPVYNIAPFLKRCINSITGQSYTDLEIIAVDDGSTDSSLIVLKELQNENKNIKVIHQDNQGVTKARLEGVRAATGNWIGFVDGDDEIEPDMYSKLIMNAIDHNADISHCGYQINSKERVVFYYGTGKIVVQDNKRGVMDLLEGSFIEPSMCNKIYRKSLFDSILKKYELDCSIRNYEDLLMNYYLFRESRISVYEDICFYHYICRQGSASSSEANDHSLGDPIKVLRIIRNDNVQNLETLNIIDERIGEQLIRLSTMKGKTKVVNRYRRNALIELRQSLSFYITLKSSIKFKIKVLIATTMPELYWIIKEMYKKHIRTSNNNRLQ